MFVLLTVIEFSIFVIQDDHAGLLTSLIICLVHLQQENRGFKLFISKEKLKMSKTAVLVLCYVTHIYGKEALQSGH